MKKTVYTFVDINSRLKLGDKKNGEETIFDNLEEVDLASYLKLFWLVD